jgi:hypothetical protein
MDLLFKNGLERKDGSVTDATTNMANYIEITGPLLKTKEKRSGIKMGNYIETTVLLLRISL